MLYLLILLAAASRLVVHEPNVAPITAIAIFAAAVLPKKPAFTLPLIARLVSDVLIGFFSWPLMVAVYASHAAGSLLGLWVKRNTGVAKVLSIAGSSLAASVLFFLVTNFAFLYSEYPHTWAGIVESYTNALPFFRGTLVGDLAYTAALFGAYEAAKYFIAKRQASKLTNPA